MTWLLRLARRSPRLRPNPELVRGAQGVRRGRRANRRSHAGLRSLATQDVICPAGFRRESADRFLSDFLPQERHMAHAPKGEHHVLSRSHSKATDRPTSYRSLHRSADAGGRARRDNLPGGTCHRSPNVCQRHEHSCDQRQLSDARGQRRRDTSGIHRHLQCERCWQCQLDYHTGGRRPCRPGHDPDRVHVYGQVTAGIGPGRSQCERRSVPPGHRCGHGQCVGLPRGKLHGSLNG
jgi:hypothetical protein